MFARYVQKGDSIDYRPSEAIAAGDVEEARRATKEHIESAENALLDVISYQK